MSIRGDRGRNRERRRRPPLGHLDGQLADPQADPPAPGRPRPGNDQGPERPGVAGVFGGVRVKAGELAGLEFGDVAQREGRWAIVDLVGKHGRVCTVPMPSWVFAALDKWAAAAGISSGPVLRPVSKGGLVGDGPITAQAVFETVIRYARLAGLGKVTPHDLRRTFAKLAHQGRAPLGQIQITLRYASIQTTERYLGCGRTCTMRLVTGWGSGAGRDRATASVDSVDPVRGSV